MMDLDAEYDGKLVKVERELQWLSMKDLRRGGEFLQ